MPATIRDEDTAFLLGVGTVPQVGLFYFDVGKLRLHCLNDAARRLRDASIPLTDDHPSLGELRTVDGKMVRGDELPLSMALRDGQPAEAAYVLARPNFAGHLHYSASPLKDGEGRIGAVVKSVICMPPIPDWPALAGLAHDLRTPLQTVTLSLQILGFRTLAEPQRSDALNRLTSAAERAQQIGKELLDWCRTRGKGDGPQFEWLSMEPFLSSVVAEQEPAAIQKGLTLATSLAAARTWQILADRSRLARILANLLVNAVRYTPPGGRVSLDASWQHQYGVRMLALEVHDTGAGISPHEQESIFHPFERGQIGRDNDPTGSGVGLSVVQHLTYELGLQCEVRSVAGQGSEFRVLVPMDKLRPTPQGSPSAKS